MSSGGQALEGAMSRLSSEWRTVHTEVVPHEETQAHTEAEEHKTLCLFPKYGKARLQRCGVSMSDTPGAL